MQARKQTDRSARGCADLVAWRWPVLSTIVPVVCLLVAMSLFSGCSRLQLPAIDPSGSSIFLPLPNTTQLDLPPLRSTPGNPGIIPTPVFTQPATPPPCLDGSNGGFCNHFGGDRASLNRKLRNRLRARGAAGEIQMTPQRVVAPVGGEVVLLAGICGADGHFVNRAPLEWMLSPDSVGTFIEVGDDKPGRLSSFLLHDPKVEKLDVDFARGRTSSRRELITRGTPQQIDDIPIGEGQTWLSISSPSEGVSHVTVLAPESEIWDHRRKTATIYWVDAQWEFPAPVITPTGQSVELLTRVTKAENFVPAEGWFVEYTILDPTVARFASNPGSDKARVTVDANGQAKITLQSAGKAFGTTPVIVDVIRPAKPTQNVPQLVIGRGQTTVTFSAPGLNLEAFGPDSGNVGGQLTYNAVVGNPGDLAAENVRLQMQIPVGTKLLQAIPQPSNQTPEYLIWEQGKLPANQQLDVAVVLEPQRPNTIAVQFRAEGTGLAPLERRITTEIVEPRLDLRFEPANNIAEVEAGQPIQYQIDVRNAGTEALANLRLVVESDPGLPEFYRGENKVEQIIPVLKAGETSNIGITFRAQQTGQLNARLSIYSGEQLLGQKTSTIRSLAPAPKTPDIDVAIEFPQQITVGSLNFATVELRNPGETKLSQVRVEIAFDDSLAGVGVDPASQTQVQFQAAKVLLWEVPNTLGESSTTFGTPLRRLTLSFRSLAATASGQITVRATCAENVEATDSTTFTALAAASPDGSVLPEEQPGQGGDSSNRSEQLKAELVDFNDPTVVGQQIRYSLIITNDRSAPARNVQARITLPEEVDFISMVQGAARVSPQFRQTGTRREVIIPPQQFLRPGEEVSFLFVVVPRVPQRVVLQAEVVANGLTPVQAEEDTTINLR